MRHTAAQLAGVAEGQVVHDADLAAGLDEGLPLHQAVPFDQGRLDGDDTVATLAHARYLGRQDAGVVDDQQVARMEEIGDIADMAVGQGISVDAEQARAFTRLGRTQGDAIVG